MAGLRRSIPWRDPVDAFAPLAGEPYAVCLLSAGLDRWSMIAADPEATIAATGENPFADLRHALASVARFATADPPLSVGAFGGFSYEAGAVFDRAARLSGSPWPDAAWGVYAAIAVFDHHTKTAWVAGADGPTAHLAARLGGPGAASAASSALAALTPRNTDAWVRARIVAAQEAIRAGAVFQVNVSRAYEAQTQAAPFAVWRDLVRASPAPFSAFMALDPDRVIAGHAPERFLSVDAKGRVRAEPIKGTRPRRSDPREDDALAQPLVSSEKDRAENRMIVDLMRNDLARVCRPGSVRVPQFASLRSWPSVHHLVSVIEGLLRADADGFDLLEASFPPGSITGAPKLAACEWIAQLEDGPRGPYCGAMGWIAPDGRLDLNVAIRTIGFLRRGRLWAAEARAGAGITIGSDPDDEVAEMDHKIAAIRSAFALGCSL
ncbi:MAG: anthranilate synthase component I family protein [Maricaulaceae bacterium]